MCSKLHTSLRDLAQRGRCSSYSPTNQSVRNARGCLQERAGTRHASQLAASFARVDISLSGNPTPLQKMQIRVWTPSDCHASIAAAGSSQVFRRVRSWRHTSGDRSRVKRDTCVASSHPSSNLGRNLFPSGVFLSRTKSAGSMAQRDNRRLICTSPRPGLRAVVRCR
jgi:hypothetical protein